MKKKLVFILLFLLFSCSNEQDYLICNSSNSEHCKFFEIKYPNYIKEFQKLNIDSEGNELAVKDLNTYLDINNIFLDKANSESIFHEFYKGIFIPRFSYSLLNQFGEEELWFSIALYPVDKKNNLITTLDTFYNHKDLKFANESIYGQCINDKNSYLNAKNKKQKVAHGERTSTATSAGIFGRMERKRGTASPTRPTFHSRGSYRFRAPEHSIRIH